MNIYTLNTNTSFNEYRTEYHHNNTSEDIQLFKNNSKADKNIIQEEKNWFIETISNYYKILKKFFTEKENEKAWNKNYNWSEGISRNISEIVLNKQVAKDTKLVNSLEQIGREVGFKVTTSKLSNIRNGMWIEDYSIRRADGKIYIQPRMTNNTNVVFKQKPIQNSILSQEYAYLYDDNKLIFGKSYIEGGNILNTRLKNGEAGAIIGLETLNYTIDAMKLKGNPFDFNLAKIQIAKDLGLKPENITYINQPDFHIDMFYRPLQDGVIAIPDFEAAIEILKSINITNMDNETKAKLIEQLTETGKKLFNSQTENKLKQNGYTIKKIPCFTVPSYKNNSTKINFQNAVCGSDKNGKSYIITNKSEYPEIDEIIEKEFKKAGINSVYFVPTKDYLQYQGGIDCLTQER